MDKITPHMYAAALLVLLALLFTYQGIFSSAQDLTVTNTDYKIRPSESTLEQINSATVLGALNGEPQRMFQNPFLEPLKRGAGQGEALVDVKIPQPPAPRFVVPTPPVLPLPGDQ